MTRAYLESAASSSSSIGGSVMPWGWATVRDMATSRGSGRWARPDPGARQRSSLLALQSHEGGELCGGTCHHVVDDDVVELLGRGELLPSGLQPADTLLGALGPAGQEPALQLLEGRRREEDEVGVRHGAADLARSLEVDLQQRRCPGAQLILHRTAGRPVPVLAVDHGPLQELAVGDHPVELGVGDEVVVHAVDLVGTGTAGGGGDREPHLGVTAADVGGDGALADGGGPGEDGQPCLGSGRGGRHGHPNRSTRDSTWLWPSPRTRRDSEIPTSAMMFRLLTFPTPGSDSRSSTTRILPKASSPLASSMTLDSVVCEYFRRFFTSARRFRAAAALASAAARCSGVRDGRATAITSGTGTGQEGAQRNVPRIGLGVPVPDGRSGPAVARARRRSATPTVGEPAIPRRARSGPLRSHRPAAGSPASRGGEGGPDGGGRVGRGPAQAVGAGREDGAGATGQHTALGTGEDLGDLLPSRSLGTEARGEQRSPGGG